MDNINELFGSNVFNDSVMHELLPKETYAELRTAMREGRSIDRRIADTIATAMKTWAIGKGATHFTHWFQPMTGITAEKHDSFITPTDDGHIIMEFSGKELIKGEPDASSFPSGGLRATFEARGYTAWDPSSFAFVKENTLCIPTAFCSFGGQALDKKTPLLRSMDALNRQALRIVRLFGMTDVRRVNTTVGPEQEYFLVDKELYDRRPDLRFCGRTLLGSMPPKRQEMSDHYFGVIKPRVKAYMQELDRELWKLGVLAKTEHNEAAPAQHELAPVFTTTNIAADHNQLTMELMKKVALKHGLVCLLHEKPFDGVNGSGKHNNWSLSTDTGVNLLNPGKNPSENLLFLLTLSSVIAAVDEHQELLRIAAASAGNDHRLGGNEAPPAILSMFLGEELTEILEAVGRGVHHDDHGKTPMTVGTEIIPYIRRDNTDRNRTSPFAFTGNKFEFRMLGSEASISDTNIMLNTMVADKMEQFADRLEQAEDFEAEVRAVIRDTVNEHGRILFNGDGYSEEWRREAKKRGLLDLESTVDALPLFTDEKNVAMFVRQGVLDRVEIECRTEIGFENYSKIIHIEALTLLEMIRRDIMPAISSYEDSLCRCIADRRAVSVRASTSPEETVLEQLSHCNATLFELVSLLENTVEDAERQSEPNKRAVFYRKNVLPIMMKIRTAADEAETVTAREYWPYPSYSELLFCI